jgi:NAD+ kinase
VSDVLLVVHGSRDDAVALAAATSVRLDADGITARTVRLEGRPVEAALDESAAGTSLVVSFGGDGTFLRASRLARAAACPVLGVNFGRLGYLLEVAPEEFDTVLDDAIAGRAVVEERLGLLVASPGHTAFALNEVTVEKTVPGHMVRVATSVNGEHLLTYAADGIVVATPTGSTAYNLSAGGPVVSPGLDVLLLTPVAPHFTIDRSIVLGPREVIDLTVLEDRPAVLVADGQLLGQLEPGTTVNVRQDPVPVRVVVGSRHGVGGRLRASLREGHA